MLAQIVAGAAQLVRGSSRTGQRVVVGRAAQTSFDRGLAS